MSAADLFEIPEPFCFNLLKHHLGYLHAFAAKHILMERRSLPEAASELVELGHLLTDVYTGALSPGQICTQIRRRLESEQHFPEASYLKWIDESTGRYRLVEIADNSVWTLLYSSNTKQYLHIHPARRSPHSIRVRSIALKVALLLFISGCIPQPKEELLVEANHLRVHFFGESPIGKNSDLRHLRTALSLLAKARPDRWQ